MVRSLRHRWIDVLLGGLLAGVSLLIYNATLTPSLSYKSPDGNELATIPYVLGLAHSTGYPLYTWLGKLFTYLPIGDVAHRVNLMSAGLGAAGVGVLYWILLTLFGRPRTWWQRTAAGFTALLFAFSRTFWSQTGIAEVYTSNVLMLAQTLFIMLAWARVDEQERAGPGDAWWRRFLPGWRSLILLSLAALSLGLSLGTHMSNLGFVPAIGLFVLLVNWRIGVSPAGWLAGISGFGLGALQFLWLPIKAGTLNDSLMSRNAPDTWRGFYNYTLGAFPQFKFAFGWSQVPDRIVIYLALLVQQFGVVGVLMGLWGMWVVLFRWPKRFFLLIGMYLVHVVFFTQYAVFDLDVFFIPSHFLFAISIGCGLWQLLGWVAAGGCLVRHRFRVDGRACHLVTTALTALIICVLVWTIGREVRANWEHNDYSDDTAINDFYESAFQLLPPDSVLLGRAGVFGYDMFYYRLVYDQRPDVLIPHLSAPDRGALELGDRPVFTTERQGIGRRGGPWAWPSDLLPADVWYVPVLLGPTPAVHGMGGSRAELVLWQVSNSPPEILLPAVQAAPQERVEIPLEGKTLIGYDLEGANSAAQAGQPVHLTLYWQIERMDNLWASVGLAGEALVNYEIGFGNLRRRVAESGLVDGGWVAVDDFWLVIPRTADPGATTLSIGEAPAINPLAGPSIVDGAARLVAFAELVIEEAVPILNWEWRVDMVTSRRLMLVAGVATLLFFHVVAAFALGVYIGQYGMTREGLTLQGPGNMRQLPPDQPPDPAPDQPADQVPARPPIPGEPTVLGRIRRIDSGMLDLATTGGPRQVLFDEQTKVWDRTGEVTSLDRLAEGQFVAILGVFHNGGQQLEADLIIILPNLQELREPSGQDPRRPAGNP